MALTRKERILQALLNDEADKCGGGLTREERMLSKLAKTSCDNDVLQGGGSGEIGDLSWDDLKDKPFGETGATIAWPDTPGSSEYVAGAYYWVSPLTPTFDELVEGEGSVSWYDLGAVTETPVKLQANNLVEYDEGYTFGTYFYVAFADNAVVGGITLPKAGLYFKYNNPVNYMSILSWGGVKTIDEAYIPDTIQRVGEPLYLTDSAGAKWQLVVGTDGTLSTTAVTE